MDKKNTIPIPFNPSPVPDHGIAMITTDNVVLLPLVVVVGVIEGIIYRTKTVEAFYQTYIVNRREWL